MTRTTMENWQEYMQVYMECVSFLNKEAELFDNGELMQWLDYLTPDIDYRVPVRVTREGKGETGFSQSAFILLEDWDSIKTRVERLNTDYAWSEQPRSRLRHMISNIRPNLPKEGSEIEVRSNFIVYRSRGDNPAFELLCGERLDYLRHVDGQLKIAKRTVYLDQTTLPMSYISFFF
ncbi:3-phenylpropionate/cinnamic acid dioxygenase small subunit [Paenibacillus sp. PvR052]|nr:3-phenylpropionate/cinnamic acid dioxygenase small subunit [Paenibacillus sp. PvR098]